MATPHEVSLKRILLTGFKPFLGDKTNPSELICSKIKMEQVTSLILPVEFQKAFQNLKAAADKVNPDYIVMLGYAAGSARLRLEKVAMNWNESLHADESGYKAPIDKIDPDQPLSVMTTFPITEVITKLHVKSYPIELSFSAGGFVCNNLYYKVLTRFPDKMPIFIHVPSENIIRAEWQAEVISEILNML